MLNDLVRSARIRKLPSNEPGVDAILLTVQEMMGSLNWAREECKANMEEAASMMFSMDVKIKNKHDASLKRRHISKTITSGGYRVTLPKFNGRKILKQGIYSSFKKRM